MSPAVDDGQFTLGQLEVIGKLPVKLSKKVAFYVNLRPSGIYMCSVTSVPLWLPW